MSANLREAIRTPEFLNEDTMKAQVLIDTQSLLVPVEEFDEADKEKLFEYSYPAGQEKRVVLYNVLPDLKAVCLFAVNKNVATVLGDRFDAGVDYIHALTPVWRQLHQRSFPDWHFQVENTVLRHFYVVKSSDFQPFLF